MKTSAYLTSHRRLNNMLVLSHANVAGISHTLRTDPGKNIALAFIMLDMSLRSLSACRRTAMCLDTYVGRLRDAIEIVTHRTHGGFLRLRKTDAYVSREQSLAGAKRLLQASNQSCLSILPTLSPTLSISITKCKVCA